MSGTNPEERFWDLVDKWRKQATSDDPKPYLSEKPTVAFAQGLNTTAEDLADLLLDLDNEGVWEARCER